MFRPLLTHGLPIGLQVNLKILLPQLVQGFTTTNLRTHRQTLERI